MPVNVPLNKGKHQTNKGGIKHVYPYAKKAWYEVPRIVINNDKPEVTIDIVETWFPERWEKKNAKANFIKKTK